MSIARCDAWTIAEALIAGRDLPPATLGRLHASGDDGDGAFILLAEVTARRRAVTEASAEIDSLIPHAPTAAAWRFLLAYAGAPTGRSYRALVDHVRASPDVGSTVIRLAPCALVGPHRRRFAHEVDRVSRLLPEFADDLVEVSRTLRNRPGPMRIQTRCRRRVRSPVGSGNRARLG